LAAFFLADFSVGFFLAALFAARLAVVLPAAAFLPDLADFLALFLAAFFLAGVLRAACFLPRDFVVLPAGALRLTFFLAGFAVPERPAAFFAAFFRERAPAGFFAMRASFVGYPTVNAKPRRPC
jgi:hypothetical protein